MAGILQPLSKEFQITGPDGKPTDYFIRWAQQRQIDIGHGITAAEANQLIVDWSGQRDIIAGFGLAGGGNLSSDVTLGLDAALGELNDVNLVTTPPADGEVLTYDAGTNTWVPGVGGGGTGNVIYFGSGAPSTLHNHGDMYMDISTTPYTPYVQWDGTVGTIGIGGGSGPTTSGALSLISEVVTSGSQSSVTFSSITSGYRDLFIVVRARSNVAASFIELNAQFNGDTGLNYDYAPFQTNGTGGVFSTGAYGADHILIGILPASTAPANVPAGIETLIYGYAQTIFTKTYNGQANYLLSTGAGGVNRSNYGGGWRSTAAINSVKIYPTSGTLVNGSIFSLYGRL